MSDKALTTPPEAHDHLRWQNPFTEDAEEPEEPEQPEGPEQAPLTPRKQGDEVIDHYIEPGGGKVALTLGKIVFNVRIQSLTLNLSETATCASHANKRWVMTVVSGSGVVGAEDEIRAFVTQNGLDKQPFYVGVRSDVDQLVVMWRCSTRDRHKAKLLTLPGTARSELLTLQRGGAQRQRPVTTPEQALSPIHI